jgi:hypothetical protein
LGDAENCGLVCGWGGGELIGKQNAVVDIGEAFGPTRGNTADATVVYDREATQITRLATRALARAMRK